MAKLNWTAEAERWLEDIFEHIARENPGAAARVVGGIYEQAQLLTDFPEIGYRYRPSSRQIRILQYGHYRIAYIVKAQGDVDILGVFHGALDIERYLI